jgi:hypothetical protein
MAEWGWSLLLTQSGHPQRGTAWNERRRIRLKRDSTGSGLRNVAARFPPRRDAVGTDTLDSTAKLIIFNRYAQRTSFEPTVPLLHWHYSERPVPHHKMNLGTDSSVKLKFEYGLHVCSPCLAGAGYNTRLKTWLSPERLSETACKQTQSGEADIPRRPLLTQRWGNRPASLWIAEDFGCCASG